MWAPKCTGACGSWVIARPRRPLAALFSERLPNIVTCPWPTTAARGGQLTRPRWDFAGLNALRFTCRALGRQVVRQVPAYAAVQHLDVLQAGSEGPQLSRA